jgi:hypothetical protein
VNRLRIITIVTVMTRIDRLRLSCGLRVAIHDIAASENRAAGLRKLLKSGKESGLCTYL